MPSLLAVLLTAVTLSLSIAALCIRNLNRLLKSTPPEALSFTPKRWTEREAQDTHDRMRRNPIDWTSHLPPNLNRRTIVTGGSGGVGGDLVLQLLLRGQAPSSIRVLDLRRPERKDLLTGAAAKIDFVHTDLTSPESTRAALAKPWPTAFADRPLTVFHVAALIDPSRRGRRAYESVKRVNVDGTRNLLDAAKAGGADIFVYCCSSSVAIRPIQFWRKPFAKQLDGFVQVLTEDDSVEPLRARDEFYSNYAYSKALGERMVLEANSPGFRTGSIRPANGIYGNIATDIIVGACLKKGVFASWMFNIVQNFVHAGNVGLGHLLFEAALARDKQTMPGCAGRAFLVTDEGAPPTFGDLYKALAATSIHPKIVVTPLEPGIMLTLSYIVEWFDIASRMPVLQYIVPRPKGDLVLLQPAVFVAGTHTPVEDTAARKSVEDGGLGYRPACTSLEGIMQEVSEWNRDHENMAGAADGKPSAAEILLKDVKNIGTAPASVSG